MPAAFWRLCLLRAGGMEVPYVVLVLHISYTVAMGEVQPYTLAMYNTPQGRIPFEDWVRGSLNLSQFVEDQSDQNT